MVTKNIKITVHEQVNCLGMRSGVMIDTLRLFVKHECNVSGDVICEQCQK
jgi:hypothetical protein